MQRRSNNSESSLSRLKDLVPFYAVPATKKTSAEIISEARAAVGLAKMEQPGGASSVGGRLGMKAVSTKRPFTPRDKQRTLFGPSKISRPPSAVSLQFPAEDENSQATTPLSPWGVRLPSLPAEQSAPTKVQRMQFRTASLSKLPEECEEDGGITLASGVVGRASPLLRKSHSNPKETTSQEGTETARNTGNTIPPACPPRPYPGDERKVQRREGEERRTRSSHSEDRKVRPSNLELKETTKPTRSHQVKVKQQQQQGKTQNDEIQAVTEQLEEVQYIINVLNVLAQEGGNDPEVVATLRKLYEACKKVQSVGTREQVSGATRNQLLRTLFKFTEREDQRVLLQMARILLTLQVVGQNLTAVCKLIFKVSRSDQNDQLFLEDNIVELLLERLGGSSPLEDAEACIYGYGALKFISMESHVLSRVLVHGGLELMVLHMKLINLTQAEGGRVPEQTVHALFQLTGALRHVAGEAHVLPAFVTSGAITQLCRTMELFSGDVDLMSNVVRTLSIVSTHEECCDAIVDSLEHCVALLEKFPGRHDVIVRLSYALGNVMARSEQARQQLLQVSGFKESVLRLLGLYLAEDRQFLTQHTHSHAATAPSADNVEDVLVKLLRVVANASLSEAVGPGLANSGAVLDAILVVLSTKSAARSEELVLGALLTLNNLSFYPDASNSLLAHRQAEFAAALCSLLSRTHPVEATIEVLRVFGNLTRWKETRDYVTQQGVTGQLLHLLQEPNLELQYVAAGVLVNLLGDPEARPALRSNGSIVVLRRILEAQGYKGDEADWELASLACQALWNCCADGPDLYDALGREETHSLLSLLVDLLDEEQLFGVAEGSTAPDSLATTQSYQLWEEFASVATNLLERLETFLESQQELLTESM